MRKSTDRILTTHVGSLPAPADLWSLESVSQARLSEATREVVRFQRDCGVDIVNEGELTKGGHWVVFVNERLTGFRAGGHRARPRRCCRIVPTGSSSASSTRRAMEGGTLFEQTRAANPQVMSRRLDWHCTSAVKYVGHAALQREIDTLRSSLGGTPPGDAFLTTTAPASLEPGRENRFYKTQEEFVFALAEAMSVEYKAIAKAGFLVQVDDAWLAALWDRIGVKMGLEAYRRYCAIRVEALNHALKGIPPEQVRYHLCWGSWHGPHAHDLPMADIVQTLLSINAQTYFVRGARTSGTSTSTSCGSRSNCRMTRSSRPASSVTRPR